MSINLAHAAKKGKDDDMSRFAVMSLSQPDQWIKRLLNPLRRGALTNASAFYVESFINYNNTGGNFTWGANNGSM